MLAPMLSSLLLPLAGKNTAITLGKEIMPAESLNYTLTTIILFSVAMSLLLANLVGVPQSTTQSTNVFIKRFDLKTPGYFQTLKRQSFFRWVVIITCCYVAFSIGSINVANASGPIASMITNELNINPTGGNFVLIMILATLIIAPLFAFLLSYMLTFMADKAGMLHF